MVSGCLPVERCPYLLFGIQSTTKESSILILVSDIIIGFVFYVSS